jgi:hypothetical protein
MGTTIATGLAARVLRPAGPGRFDPAELDGLPEPVRRHLAMAVAPGTPLATSARLAMRAASRSAAGCRSGPARCSTPTTASSGRPGRPG